MKVYRYNSKKREDRKFNTTGLEKNPNNVTFFATNLKYAENYRFVYFQDGEVNYECELISTEIESVNLFDMTSNFKTLETYKTYISQSIGAQLRDYTKFRDEATTARERKMWDKNLADLENREEELIQILFNQEFQPLSDYEMQNALIEELRNLGFDGYKTTNEIAIF